MAIITDEQRIELERNARFQDVTKQFVKNRGIFLTTNNGNPPPGSMTQIEWAKQRTIGAGVVQHPNSQDYNEWTMQFSMFLKGQDVWNTDADTTISAMIASGKFDELSELTYALRAQRIEF